MLNRSFFDDLPKEILGEILPYLSPEAATNAASVDTKFKTAASDNLFWQKKLQRHFPCIFNTIKIENNINWRDKFCKTYDDEYRDLSVLARKIFSLVKESDVESLNKIQISIDILDSKDKHGVSILSLAQKINHQQVLDYLYQAAQRDYAKSEYIIDTTKKDSSGRTILYWAIACHQNQEQISLLVLQGSKLDEKYFDTQCQPIHIAAQEGRLDVVHALIENKPELLNQVDANDQTPLIGAATKGHLPVVQYLLSKNGVNVNAATQGFNEADKNGRTALHWAADHGHSEVVDALVKAGAATTLTAGNMQYQPIHIAAQKGRLDVVQLFIENKPELLNQVDVYGQTPLMWAASKGHLSVVQYLLSKNGINVNAASYGFGQNQADKNGRTALHWAADHGNSEVVDALVKAGAVTTLAGNTQLQPVHIAAQEGRLDVVQLFIENKPELLNQVDAYGQTPLIWAASKGHLPVVQYLLAKNGVNLNAETQGFYDADKNGRTALHWAADHGHSEVVDVFIKKGEKLKIYKPVDKSQLTEPVKAKYDLLEYISKRKSEPKYKTSFTLFCYYEFNFGFSRKEKLDAAEALENVVFNGADKNILNLYQDELNNGDLKSIYHSLRMTCLKSDECVARLNLNNF